MIHDLEEKGAKREPAFEGNSTSKWESGPRWQRDFDEGIKTSRMETFKETVRTLKANMR